VEQQQEGTSCMAAVLNFLTRAKDPRPRCVLVLGDGFTQGFLKSQGLDESVRSRISGHFDNHELLKYEPAQNETRMWERRPWRDAPFWSEIHWPKLYRRWQDGGFTDAWAFYNALAEEQINPTPGAEGVDQRSIAYELRCYLWHMMRSWQRVIWLAIEKKGHYDGRWEWFYLLPLLVRKYHLTAVTFNYDEVFRDALFDSTREYPELAGIAYRRSISRPIQYLENLPAETVVSLHVHGSIAHWLEGGFEAAAGEVPNPWLTEGNVIRGSYSLDSTSYQVDPKLKSGIPYFPSLLPPGHGGTDMGNFTAPWLNASRHARWYIGHADLAIFCGLSGRPPDTGEVRYIVGELKRKTRVYQVGCERDVPLTHMLSAHPNYTFIEAASLMQIMEDIPR
jgi:hypothetical protein